MTVMEPQPVAAELALGPPRWWWLWMLTGFAWMLAALVVLQFDAASVTTAGILIGCMFLAFGAQQLVVAVVADSMRGLWIAFAVVFLICGIVCLIQPAASVAGFADMLGFFIFATGVWWTIEAFLGRGSSTLWWLQLIIALATIVIAFWISGQFFVQKAYSLLILVGVWSLLHGAGDLVRAYRVWSGRDFTAAGR
jgi:uncharacterized membrane protein HdeD (DUF308 family)